jgi:hypothetical protein
MAARKEAGSSTSGVAGGVEKKSTVGKKQATGGVFESRDGREESDLKRVGMEAARRNLEARPRSEKGAKVEP